MREQRGEKAVPPMISGKILRKQPEHLEKPSRAAAMLFEKRSCTRVQRASQDSSATRSRFGDVLDIFTLTPRIFMQLVKSTRDTLLRPLQIVSGIVERRHTMPILANILIRKNG
ncbi:MAG: hypothetical protein ACJ8HJ_01670, partial [Massilia sp.]